jgi:hypothetical protein
MVLEAMALATMALLVAMSMMMMMMMISTPLWGTRAEAEGREQQTNTNYIILISAVTGHYNRIEAIQVTACHKERKRNKAGKGEI